MSPSSMLLPRRGQSPARGLVRNGNDATNDEPSGRTGTDYSDGGPIDIEEHPRDDGRNRHADRTAGAPLLRRDRYSPVPQDVERPSRSAGFPQVLGDSISQRQPRQQEVPHAVRGGMDHYSPPPEDEDESHRHISRRRSVSPPRRTGMRSDDILSNQYASRRSVSPPRSHGESRTFERPLLDRMHSESRMRAGSVRGRVASDALKERDSSRRFDERSQRREGQEFVDPRGDELRELDVRTSRHDRHVHVGMSPQDRTSPMHGRNGDMFPGVDIEDPAYHEVPPGIHTSRSERFHGRPDIQRTHSSRAGIAHLSRSDVRVDSPRLSPHAIRNDVPLPQRHEYPPRDRMMNRGRSQNGAFGEADALGLGDRDLQSLHRDGLLQDTESPIIAEDRELHSAGPRGDGRSRHIQGQHRQTGSHGGYVANQEFNSPGFPEHHSSGPRVFSGRDRDFPREQEFQAEEPPFQGGERDFGPREDDRFQPNERRNRGFELHGGPRDQRLAEPIIHEHGLSPHARERLLSHEDQISPQSRAFIPPSSQRRDPPPHARIVHTREREQDSHIQDRTSKTWERGVEVPTPPPEQVRIDGRGRESGSRKERREGGADMEYSGTRGDRRRTEGENVSTYESEHKSATNRYGNWANRNADSDPSPRGGPVPLRMDMDVDPEPSPSSRNEPLPGWAGFRHRDRAADMEKSARTYRGRREGWPVVEGEQDPPNVDSEDDGRKRRRIDNGSNMSTKFGRDEQELREYYTSLWFARGCTRLTTKT
ncbi:hypothetical protein BDV93DRAFT_42698 [Ceratobasidium sp. AG-I]|nr:hypothetical protein BDV93DRAFT_42698 [Ceratobasidium sp. AG-I]